MNPFIIVLFYLLFTRTLRYSQIYPSIRCVCCWYYYVYIWFPVMNHLSEIYYAWTTTGDADSTYVYMRKWWRKERFFNDVSCNGL